MDCAPGGENIDLSLFYFRLLSVFAVIGILFYVAKLAKAHGFNQVRALWQIGPNPLFIASFIASGHNDSLMTMFMLGGLYTPSATATPGGAARSAHDLRQPSALLSSRCPRGTALRGSALGG